MAGAKAYFIGHGSPFNLVKSNPFTMDLDALAKTLQRPKAVVVISAHFLTRGSMVTASDHPRQINDFYGFPKELYEVRYPARGDSRIARMLIESVSGNRVLPSDEWGIDHAATIPLMHMFPDADVPVLELSVDLYRPAKYHFDLGRALAPVREKGVMFVGSGNLVHTFRELDWSDNVDPFPWAVKFDGLLKKAIIARDHESLVDYERIPGSNRAFQTPDHYLPMLYILGMQGKDESVRFFHEGFQHGSISHRSFEIG